MRIVAKGNNKHHPSVEIKLEIGEDVYKRTFYIDTGFSYELLMDEAEIPEELLAEKSQKTKLKLGDGTSKEFRIVIAKKVAVGGKTFRNVPIYIKKGVPSLMGIGLLKELKFLYDGPKKKFIFYDD